MNRDAFGAIEQWVGGVSVYWFRHPHYEICAWLIDNRAEGLSARHVLHIDLLEWMNEDLSKKL